MKFKILIIDDEQSIRDIFSLLLDEKGYAVESAATGAAGSRLRPGVSSRTSSSWT